MREQCGGIARNASGDRGRRVRLCDESEHEMQRLPNVGRVQQVPLEVPILATSIAVAIETANAASTTTALPSVIRLLAVGHECEQRSHCVQ